jgi:hypothetical protein
MTDEQKLIIAKLRQREKDGVYLTVEDVLNELAADPDDHRRTLANALESLVWERYVIKDMTTGALKLSEVLK